nr:DUF4168 domain-containing protein [Iningainema tapete]
MLFVGTLSAQAQAPQPSPNKKTQAPAASAKVSQEELKKFAQTMKQLQPIVNSRNQEMKQVVSQSGLSEERFLEIYQSQRDASAKPTKAITPQEKQQYEKALPRLSQIQEQAQVKMQQVFQKEGLEPARFNQILAAVRQDPALQQTVQKMIQS